MPKSYLDIGFENQELTRRALESRRHVMENASGEYGQAHEFNTFDYQWGNVVGEFITQRTSAGVVRRGKLAVTTTIDTLNEGSHRTVQAEIKGVE